MREQLPVVHELADEAIDGFIDDDEFDIVHDLAGAVPSRFTMDVMGLPREHAARWAEYMHLAIGSPPEDQDMEAIVSVGRELDEVTRAIVRERMDDPSGDDMISLMCGATLDGERLGEDLIMENVRLVISGGIDTTTGLITNSMVWLAQHPDERARLRDDPTLLPAATEELLRFFSPVLALARTVATECTFGGQQLAEGDRALLCFGAANMDEDEFPDPDVVKLDRFPNRHLAFGVGAHRCIGSNLARTTFQGTMERVLDRLPDYEVLLDRAVRYTSVSVGNGWFSMPARVHAP
jgi:cytochrome P450